MKLPITGFEPHISGVGSDGSTNQLGHNHCCMLLGSFKGSSHLTHGAAVDCRFGKLKILLSVCKNATFCNIHIWKMQLVWIILFLVVHKTSLLYGEKCLKLPIIFNAPEKLKSCSYENSLAYSKPVSVQVQRSH